MLGVSHELEKLASADGYDQLRTEFNKVGRPAVERRAVGLFVAFGKDPDTQQWRQEWAFEPTLSPEQQSAVDAEVAGRKQGEAGTAAAHVEEEADVAMADATASHEPLFLPEPQESVSDAGMSGADAGEEPESGAEAARRASKVDKGKGRAAVATPEVEEVPAPHPDGKSELESSADDFVLVGADRVSSRDPCRVSSVADESP